MERRGWHGSWVKADRGAKMAVGSNGWHRQQGLEATVAGVVRTGKDQDGRPAASRTRKTRQQVITQIW